MTSPTARPPSGTEPAPGVEPLTEQERAEALKLARTAVENPLGVDMGLLSPGFALLARFALDAYEENRKLRGDLRSRSPNPAAPVAPTTPDTGEAPSEYRAGPLRYAFIKGVRLGAKSLTNGELMTAEDVQIAAKLAYPDEPVTEPRITPAAPTTDGEFGKRVDALEAAAFNDGQLWQVKVGGIKVKTTIPARAKLSEVHQKVLAERDALARWKDKATPALMRKALLESEVARLREDALTPLQAREIVTMAAHFPKFRSAFTGETFATIERIASRLTAGTEQERSDG